MRTEVRFPASPVEVSEIGYLQLPSRNMAEILLSDVNPQCNQPTNSCPIDDRSPSVAHFLGWLAIHVDKYRIHVVTLTLQNTLNSRLQEPRAFV